jgi:outer membrane murein-binding lipoprotein Lpp
MIVIFAGCSQQPDELQQQINDLTTKRDFLQSQLDEAQEQLDTLNEQVTAQQEQLDVLNHEEKGEEARYVLTLELKQSHFALDIKNNIKDSFNKTSFEIPVDKEFYDGQTAGSELVREFRKGSLFFGGTFGDWVVTVTDKKIEYIEE